MRVLAVTKVPELACINEQALGMNVLRLGAWGLGPCKILTLNADFAQGAGDGGVVAAGVGEGAAGQVEAELQRRATGSIELRGHLVVVLRRHDNQDVAKILGGGPHQAGPADVDLLDHLIEANAWLGRRLDKRIEIDDDQIDHPNAMLLGQREVFRMMPAGENAAVNLRVQRLDAPVHHLGKASDVADVHDRQAGAGQRFGSASSRHQFEASGGQRLGERHEARLV